MACTANSLLASAAASGYYGLDDRNLKLAILYMLCSGGAGGGGSGGLSQGSGAPVTAPTDATVTNAYFDTDTGTMYYWNTTSQAWL